MFGVRCSMFDVHFTGTTSTHVVMYRVPGQPAQTVETQAPASEEHSNMRWSFRLMTVAGIGLYIHVTFFLLLLWIGATYYLPRHSLPDVFDGLAFVVAV